MRRAGATLVLAACAATPSIPYADVDDMMSGCVACHGPERTEAELDLTDFYDATVGVPSGQLDMNLIEPGDYVHSYIWHKCNGSQLIAGGAGSSMPLGTTLSRDQLADLAYWIDGGALR